MVQLADGDLIAVMGATAGQGAATAAALAAQGRFRVRGLSRNPDSAAAADLKAAGAEVVAATPSDEASLAAAFRGCAGVFAVTASMGRSGSFDVVAEEAMGRAAVAAAAAEGVKHFVFTSVCDAEADVPHFQSKLHVEEALKASGLPYTILRPVAFMDNFIRLPQAAITAGKVPGLTPAARSLKYIAVSDIGRAAAVAFGDASTWTARTVSLAGDDVAGVDVAATVGRVRGKGETFGWSAAPRLLLRLFAPEMYRMAVFMDAPGYSDAALAETREMLPDALTLEEWLKASSLKDAELRSRACAVM